MAEQVVKVGAVGYDPKVITIWEAMREYFQEAGVPTDYLVFSNYEAQVDALFRGIIDIAWNTNVAYARCEKRAGGACQVLGMRDTDIDFTTRLVARVGSGIHAPADLRGKRLALGSADSAQAAIMPLFYLQQAGLDPAHDLTLLRFDVDVGKHGDTGTSELEVLRALQEGRADAGAIGHTTWLRVLEQGQVSTSQIDSVWTSPPYDHCNFTALPDFDRDLARRWETALLAMDASDPRWRRLMDLEGLNRWVAGNKEGYKDVMAALSS
jgi:ABC-type phosphate/phosphonate transport system substrate-binding protein